MTDASYAQEFEGLTHKAIDAIARDPLQPRARRRAARAFLSTTASRRLGRAARVFDKATKEIGRLTKRLTPGRAARKLPAAPAGPRRIEVIRTTGFAALAAEYEAMFDAADLNLDKLSLIDGVRAKLTGNRAHYEIVEMTTGLPWHIVGLIHGLEAGFRFDRHLHNGDPLSARTKHAPSGRPPAIIGEPPFAWEVSAADAVKYMKLDQVSDWSLARQLYELERYNGFGYRFKRLPTPYLWSFTSQYQSGKFVRDGVYDPTAISRQAGAAGVLKRMVELGDIAAPTRAS